MTNDRFPPKMFFARINSERGCSSLSVHSLVLWYALYPCYTRQPRRFKIVHDENTPDLYIVPSKREKKRERKKKKERKKEKYSWNSQCEVKMFVRGRIGVDRWEPERVSRTYEAERLSIRSLRWIIKFNIRAFENKGCWIIINNLTHHSKRKFQRIVYSSPILLQL